MSNFISWIEKDGNIYYLTAHDIYRTKRGKELRDYCGAAADVIGHGAIRFYFDNFTGGEEKECTDFSTPDNFPSEIVAEIKIGAFRGMGKALALLSKPANAEFEKIYKPANAEFEKIYKPAKAEFDKICKPANAEFEKICKLANAEFEKIYKLANAEFEKIYKPAKAEFDKICKPANAEYDKICNHKFWDLFMIPKNRNLLWI